MTARLVADIEIAGYVCAVEQLRDDIVVAVQDAVLVVRDERLEPLIKPIEVLAMRGEYILTPRDIVKLDGTRISLPAFDGLRPRRFCPLASGAIVAIDDLHRPDVAAVVRLDGQGTVMWRAPILPPAMLSGYVSEARATDNFTIKPARPWTPVQWNIVGGDLLISSDRVLATFAEMPRSGIGICYGIDLDMGEIVYQTPPAPYGEIAPGLEPGSFLVGVQGYGAFETWLVDRCGVVCTTWASHGSVLRGDPVRIVELENVSPSRSHVSTLFPGGRVHHGAHLPGYYTSPVVVARDGGAVLWRDNALLYVSPDGERIERLLQTPERGRPHAPALAGRAPGRLALCWSTTFEASGARKNENRLLLIDVSC